MKNSLIFGVVLGFIGLTTSASASTILSATQHSGYTTQEDAFENHCDLSSTGVVTGYQSKNWNGTGWVATQPISFSLTQRAIRILKTQISLAKAGPFSNGDAVCDAGSVDISARKDTDPSSYIVVNALDCAPSHLNQSAASQSLRVWVANQCKIKY
jgi:hypothetical protein